MIKKIFIALLCLMAAAASGADKLVVGYYPSWSSGSFPHTAVPWQDLTHVVHAFIGPQADGTLDVPSDFLYPLLNSTAHVHGVKAIVSVGGWNETYDNNFRALAADSTARRAFAANLAQFCHTNNYDGADLDWEFPGSVADRANHALMVHAIRQAFDNATPRLTLSMAAPATDWGGKWFDYTATANDFDWIGIMTYDFFGDWSSMSGPNSPLYRTIPQNDQGCIDMSVSYYNSTRGFSKSKLLIGVPFYGWTFNSSALYGPLTGSPTGVQEDYSTIAPRLAQGWTRSWDGTGQVPYMQNAGHTKLTSYDDSASVALKAAYVQSSGVAGVIIWALGQDLVGGHPVLLETLGKALRPATGIASEEQGVPTEFGLEQNWPNPFNPSTVIRYTLTGNGNRESGIGSGGPRIGKTTLIVYDVLGRQVATLVDEVKAPGSYEVRFDGSGLSSGTYFYRLTAGTMNQSRQMILLK